MISEKDFEAQPPVATQKPETLQIHNSTRIDPYFWMRLSDAEKAEGDSNPHTKEVYDYLRAENAYRQTVMKPLEPLQEKLYNEIVGRIKQTDTSVPYELNGYSYYTRFEEGLQYPVYCRKKSGSDVEEIMLDANKMAEGHSYFAIGSREVSPDNNLLVYGQDTVSRRIYSLHIKNLASGEHLADVLVGTTGSAIWSADGNYLFYTAKDPITLRSNKIYRHKLGSPQSADVLIYEEPDATFYTWVQLSGSRQMAFIVSRSTVSSEYRYLNLNDPTGTFQVFEPRERDHEYSIDHLGNDFYIYTNYKARNFRLMKAPAAPSKGKDTWVEVVAHRESTFLAGFELFTDYLALEERKDGLTHLSVRKWDADTAVYLPFNDPAYVASIGYNANQNSTELRFDYTSLTTPNSTIAYNMATGEQTVLKQQEVLGDFDASRYESKRLMIPARDGTLVPVSLVRKAGVSGPQPLLLYGYGSYGASMDPYFSSVRLSLLDRGMTFAIAHIRGGQEMGRQWYEDGKMMNKMNTFTDFIDCAEYLVKENYADTSNLFAMGGSAGGLLMGAVVNMRPDLWKGVVAQVPFVDVLSTMLDETIPLTTGEYDEWGNPNNAEAYAYMAKYSPYDNVTEQPYPHLYITTGLYDSQVQYWEPAKWVARLREKKTNDNLILLDCNMETGHGGASGRYDRYREVAREYSFLLWMSGLND